ncbi:MAG: VCBS repeat-containing protein [Candidatus Lambdaproteobacteria bacterium]|nr:VCBS repeat-containing protein [Candidatus Lambdaproteobacteria bacterium]
MLACLLLALLAPEPVRAQAPVSPGFERFSLRLAGELGDLHAIDLDGDGLLDLVVVENDLTRRDVKANLAVFLQEPQGFRRLEGAAMPLPAGLILAGVGRFEQGPGLALLTGEGVAVHPWRGTRFDPLPALTAPAHSVFPAPDGLVKTGLPWIADLHGDGRSELLIPQPDGYEVLGQQGERLVRLMRLRTRPRADVLNWFRRNLAAYEIPALAIVQSRSEGWRNVLTYVNGIVQVHDLGAPLSPEGVARSSLQDLQPPRPFDPNEPRDPPLLLARAGDLNGDGVPDLVFTKTSAADTAWRSSTTVMIYYGRRGEPGTPVRYVAAPDQVYASDGFQLPILLDFSDDGRVDMVLVNVEVTFWNAIKSLIASSVNAQAAFYLMPPGGRYERAPASLVDFSVKFSLGRYAHQPIATFGDFNGDGVPDLLLSVDRRKLGVHWGRRSRIWDTTPDLVLEDYLPIHIRRLRVLDLDNDGRADLIFAYNRDDIRQMPEVLNTVTVLRSRNGAPRSAMAGEAARQGTTP